MMRYHLSTRLLIFIAVSLFTMTITAAGCGDSAAGNDGGVDAGDGGLPDAVVDNGPLDCGVAPNTESNCVQGRLYDFESNEPVPAGAEGEIVSYVGLDDLTATLESANLTVGRIDPNGRFYAWTNGTDGNASLAVLGPVGPYTPTINSYSFYFGYDNPDEVQFYVMSSETIAVWEGMSPGDLDVTGPNPLFIGTCTIEGFIRMTTGQIGWSYTRYGGNWPYDLYDLGDGYRSLTEVLANQLGPMPSSGSRLFVLGMDYADPDPMDMTDIELRCEDGADWNNSVPVDLRRHELIDHNIKMIFINTEI